MKNESNMGKYKLNQHLVSFYNYYVEYVAIQVRRLTKIIFVVVVSGIYVLWQLGIFPAEIVIPFMMLFVLLGLILSQSFLWQNNEIAYQTNARRAFALRIESDTQATRDPDSYFIQCYDGGYPMLYHRLAYILACAECGYTQRKHERLSGLYCLERCLYRLLF